MVGLEPVTACFGPLSGPTRSTDVVYAVHGGDRVTIMIDATETGGAFDVVEVLVQPGRAAPPHCHAFAEWFHILDGAVQFLTASCGALQTDRDRGTGRHLRGAALGTTRPPEHDRHPGPVPPRRTARRDVVLLRQRRRQDPRRAEPTFRAAAEPISAGRARRTPRDPSP